MTLGTAFWLDFFKQPIFSPSQCPTLDACISQLFLKFQEDMNDMGVFFILKSVLGMVGWTSD